MNMGWHVAAVAAGGAVGASLRFGANELFVRQGWYGLPLATLAVNVAGCLLAGMVLVWLEYRGPATPLWRSLLMTGFLGGLTTFSALGVELWQLLRAERYLYAIATSLAHLLLGVLAVAAGFRLARACWPGTGG